MNELVTIIMPLYNAEQYLEDTILSILNQSYKKIELILINDGSTDNSLDICLYYKEKDERIKLINTPNQGVSHARNIGIKESQGQYIMFCDADDLYHNEFVRTMVENLESNQSDLCVCKYMNFKHKEEFDNVELSNNKLNYENQNDIYKVILFEHEISGYVWNKIFLREIILDHNLHFNHLVHEVEDLLFVIQYLRYTKKMTQIESQLYFYRDNPTSIMHQKFNLKKYSSIYGRVNIYDEIKFLRNDAILEQVWIQVIECCFSYFKNIILCQSFPNKRLYLLEIITFFAKIKDDYRKSLRHISKLGVKYNLLRIIGYIFKT